MSSNSPISKTSPMIIRLFSTPPVAEGTTAINPIVDSNQSTSKSSPSGTSSRGVKRKQTEKSKLTNVVANVKSSKNPEYSSLEGKSSDRCGRQLRKIMSRTLRLDSRVSSDFKSHIKQRKKNLSCPVSQTKEIDIPVLHSVPKPLSKQSTILLSNAEKGKSVSTSVVKITNAKLSCELSKLKNKLTKLPSKNIQTKNKKKLAQVPTVSIHEPADSLVSNKVCERVVKGNRHGKSNEKSFTKSRVMKLQPCIQSLPLTKCSKNLFSEITVDVKDGIDTKITTVGIDKLPLQSVDRNLSNSNVSCSISLLEPVKEECPHPTITQPSPAFLNADKPILPIQSFRLLPEIDSNLDRNLIPLSNIKVEIDVDKSNETVLCERDKLELSKEDKTTRAFKNVSSDHTISLTNIKVEKYVDKSNEVEFCDQEKLELSKEKEIAQVFKNECSDHEMETSDVMVESFVIDQPSYPITQEVDLCGEIPRKELPSEITVEAIHEIELSTNAEDSKQPLFSQSDPQSSSENTETVEFSNSETFNWPSNDSLETKLESSVALPDVNIDNQSPKEKGECDNSKSDRDVPKEILNKHSLPLVSLPCTSTTINYNEFEDFENCQKDLNWEVCNADSPETPFSAEKDLIVDPPVKMDKFKVREKTVENKIKKRQYRTHTSSSPQLAMVEQVKDSDLVEDSEEQNAVELPDLSWKDQVITDDDVCELEITELEKIRELLRQQLSQDNEDSSDTLDSTNGMDPITVEAPEMPTDIESELGENNSLATSVLEKGLSSGTAASNSCTIPDGKLHNNFDFGKKCPISVSASKKDEQSPKKLCSTNSGTSKQCEPIEKKVPERLEKADLPNITRKRYLEEGKSSCKNKHNEQVSSEAEPVTDKPPLVMQSSNLLFNYGLDNRHGGGGSKTTDVDVDELCPRKKLKLASTDDTLEDVDNCNPQQSSQDVLTVDDQLSGGEHPLIQCEDSSSNPAMDFQDCEQNDLMEFDILDEFESDGNEENDDSDMSSDDGFDLDEIDAMLDEKLQERMNNKSKLDPNDTEHEEKEKIVLKARGRNHFDLLPEGWIEVTHNSGMPIYLHKMSRVCSMSKPYFLGPGSTRKHEIPVSAIPCLHYLKEKEKEQLNKNDETVNQNTVTANNGVGTSSKNGEVETSNKKREVDTSTTNGEVDTSTTNGEVDTSTTNEEVTTNGEVDTTTANGEVSTSIINGEVDISTTNVDAVTSTTNGEVDTSSTNDKVGSSITPLNNVSSVTKENSTDKVNLNSVTSIFPSAKLESAKDTKESGSLDYLAVRDYCAKRFDFTRITVKRFRTWSGRRRHIREQKHSQRPFLPDNTKLITCPLYTSEKTTATGIPLPKREFIMNPCGKSPVCILHEYVQHTLRLQPKYVFKELENASTPYGAVVVINGIEYGCGFGSSKKSAKSDAARSALEILIPKMKILSREDKEDQDVEFFDQVRIEDPRICDLSVKAGQPYPYQILLECIKRNYGMGETTIECKMSNIKHQKNEFHMTCGKHKASVVCKNKRDGKHRASQAILQKLHPHISSWGSLLRMYGKGSCKTMKEKKEEEQQITELQSKATANKPNLSILCKLKDEMLKYREKVKSKKPIGKLIPESMEFPSSSSSNLKNVEL